LIEVSIATERGDVEAAAAPPPGGIERAVRLREQAEPRLSAPILRQAGGADAHRHVVATPDLAPPPRHLDQPSVADGATVTVVDRLEGGRWAA